jgi:hypothetical protein
MRHNAKEFDIPFIARRMIINQVQFLAQFIWEKTMGNSAFRYVRIMEIW